MTEKYTHLRGVSVALRGIFCRNERKISGLLSICALAAQMLGLFRRRHPDLLKVCDQP